MAALPYAGGTNLAQTTANQTVNNDIQLVIQDALLPLVKRNMFLHRFAQKLRIENNAGLTYTAIRYQRLPLPTAPLAEAVPSSGAQLSFTVVQASVQQWGSLVRFSDIAEITYKHNIAPIVRDLLAMQMAEVFERETVKAVLTFPQVNFARGASGTQVNNRAALTAANTLRYNDILRTSTALRSYGVPATGDYAAPSYTAETDTSMDNKMDMGVPGTYPFFCAPAVESDLRTDAALLQVWSGGDSAKEHVFAGFSGKVAGVAVNRHNFMPTLTGQGAMPTIAANSSGGTFAAGSYVFAITGVDASTGYETLVWNVSSAVTIAAGGSVSITLPSVANFTGGINVYVGLASGAIPTNYGLSPSGPVTGAYAGQAVNLPEGATVTITGIGLAQVPPLAPASGVTVYRSPMIGKDAFGFVNLDTPKVAYVSAADHADPQAQTRVASWKALFGVIILNNAWAAVIESTSAFGATYDAGTINNPD